MATLASRNPEWVVHVLAHEMGHHLWKNVLSSEAQDFWSQTIHGSGIDIDLKDLLAQWAGDAWAFEFSKVMGKENPILAIQVEALSHDEGYGNPQTKEDFQRLYDRGLKTIRAPEHPITGYAHKNTEEAFCETLGLLVTHGPRSLHERVRYWFHQTLPGVIKVGTKDCRL